MRPEHRVTLETDRLRIEPIDHEHTPRLVPVLNDRRISERLSNVPFPYGADDAASFVNLVHESDGETHAWLLVPRDNPGVRIVGGCGLHDVVGNEAEFGYWIATDEWGKGYATEAARELLRHAFGTLRFERIEGAYFRSNPASRRVMEKVGLTPMPEGSYDGVIVCRDGREEPAWRVAITRGAWLASS